MSLDVQSSSAQKTGFVSAQIAPSPAALSWGLQAAHSLADTSSRRGTNRAHDALELLHLLDRPQDSVVGPSFRVDERYPFRPAVLRGTSDDDGDLGPHGAEARVLLLEYFDFLFRPATLLRAGVVQWPRTVICGRMVAARATYAQNVLRSWNSLWLMFASMRLIISSHSTCCDSA